MEQSAKAVPVGIIPMISYSDGTTGTIEKFLETMEPEIATIRNKALKTYRKEMDESIRGLEKAYKQWPDFYRTEVLRAGQTFFQCYFSCHQANEQQIPPGSELAFALTLQLRLHFAAFNDLIAQASAELSGGKFSKEKVLNILSIVELAAEMKPWKITESKIEGQRGGRNPKTPLTAEIQLYRKHVLASAQPALEALLPGKRNNQSGRRSGYEEHAKSFIKLALSEQPCEKASMYHEVCKEHVPGYDSLDYDSHQASNQRNLVGTGIRHLLGKYEEPARHFDRLKHSSKPLKKSQMLDNTCKKYPRLAKNYASLNPKSEEARGIRERFDLMIQYWLSDPEWSKNNSF